MKLKKLFPQDIWELIFSFDPTYHEIFQKNLIEFDLKTALWRVRWLNNVSDYGNIVEQQKYNRTDFQSTRVSLQYIIDYWNYTYPDYYRQLDDYEINCEGEFITDNCEGTKELMRNLKILKKYKIKFNEKNTKRNEWILYKPGKKGIQVSRQKTEHSHYWSRYVSD